MSKQPTLNNDTTSSDIPPYIEEPEEEISLLDLLIRLAQRKRLILGVTAAGTLLALVIALLLPNKYTATAIILPPQQQSSVASQLLGQLGSLAGIATGSSSSLLRPPGDTYVGILKSHSIAEAIVKQYDLQQVYKSELLDTACTRLTASTQLTASMDALIKIAVTDLDPQRAANLANAYVEQLRQINGRMALTESSRRRLFFEQQLARESEELAHAEADMKQVQQRTGLIQNDSQARVLMESIGSLQAQIVLRETALSGLAAGATEQNPEVVRLRSELDALRQELARRQETSGGGGTKGSLDPMLPLGKVPEASLEYLRGLRSLKYHETLYELLAKQFEIAKLDEARDAPIIQVVDKAVPPQRKSSPHRALIVLMGMILSGMFGGALALLHHEHSNQHAKWRELGSALSLRRSQQ